MTSLTDQKKSINRREFLKLGIGALAAWAFSGLEPVLAADTGISLGRVVNGSLEIYDQPSFRARRMAQFWQDMVLPITGRVTGEEIGRNVSTWFRIGNIGYAHSTELQPVKIDFNQPTSDLRFTGSLAVVTVPFTDVYHTFSRDSVRLYRYYYGANFWVNKLVYDRDGRAWYRVRDDKFPQDERWVLADRMKIYTDEELAPISPDVQPDEKRLEVYLEEQRVAAFEADQLVFEAPVSTGDVHTNPKYQTPTGSYLVGLKRPSQHMMPWDRTFGSYDLPGVPWVCYFTAYAHAFHGAYWHNGFGKVRSHGCVNLSPEDARWIYLWSTPVMQPFNELQYQESGGTRVLVI